MTEHVLDLLRAQTHLQRENRLLQTELRQARALLAACCADVQALRAAAQERDALRVRVGELRQAVGRESLQVYDHLARIAELVALVADLKQQVESARAGAGAREPHTAPADAAGEAACVG